MTTYTFTALTNQDKAFYPTLGPFLANRAVIKQLGDTPHDDNDKTWIVAKTGRKVVGFIVYTTRRDGRIATESCYTTPGHDDLRPHLVQAVLDAVGTQAEATVRHEYAPAYKGLGFGSEPSRYEAFTKLVRPGE